MFRIVVCGIAAVSCLAGAVTVGLAAGAEMTRKPTTEELAAAASTGITQRWDREPAGAIFPASIGYSTDLLTQETAARLGISPVIDCAASVDHALLAFAARYRCRAGLRASYADQLQGVVYTIGVLAFPTAAAAADFAARLPRPVFPASGLHALTLAGTVAARFGDAARQLAVARRAGPYLVLVVAGYSDGRAATATQQRRDSAFASASQLADTVAAPLGLPETVDCRAAGEWSC